MFLHRGRKYGFCCKHAVKVPSELNWMEWYQELFWGWSVDWLVGGFNWLIDWLIDYLMNEWLIGSKVGWVIRWLTDWSIDWLNEWMNDWLIG